MQSVPCCKLPPQKSGRGEKDPAKFVNFWKKLKNGVPNPLKKEVTFNRESMTSLWLLMVRVHRTNGLKYVRTLPFLVEPLMSYAAEISVHFLHISRRKNLAKYPYVREIGFR
jgi:hypothetical protein